MNDELGPLACRRLEGREPLHRNREPLGVDVLAFWQWAASNLVGNTFRGCFAEFLVAVDLGLVDGTRRDWEGCDIVTADNLRIEVKTSGYIQTWKQKRLSRPIFSIGRARAWDPTTDTYTTEVDRHSDAYVFCLHHHEQKSTVDPLDVTQWTFYILPTSVINERFGERKSISLPELNAVGASQTTFGQIGATTRRLLGRTIQYGGAATSG